MSENKIQFPHREVDSVSLEKENCFARIFSMLDVLGTAADNPSMGLGNNVLGFVQTLEREVKDLQELVYAKEEVQS